MFLCKLLFLACVELARCAEDEVQKFPEGFLFGASTSAYQIEGAWNADGKTENVWDVLTHTLPDVIADKSNGDIAVNSYYEYERDVQMLRELGVNHYRFSVSWNRILPSGFANGTNEAGVQYYNNLIDELLKHNIQPVVTLYHFDLPQRLQNLGGWINPNIITWFSDYARTVFALFGDRVKYFITINEPFSMCYGWYELTFYKEIEGMAEYMCTKNMLLAHAKAYHIYDEEFRPRENGKIFISINAEWFEPATNSESDIKAADDANIFNWQQYAWPIFSETGDFPPEMKKRIAAKSAEQGFPRSRLPELTPEEVDLIKGSSDFFGLNHYSTQYVYRNSSVPTYDIPSFDDDLGVATYQSPDWQIGASTITMYVPWGFRKLLNRINEDFNNFPVFITENGFATYGGLIDNDRVQYHRGYLSALLDAISDGCNIKAYTVWSLMDNFEWLYGYTVKYGLNEVDFNSENKTCTPRKSAYVYKEIIRTHQLDLSYEPDLNNTLTIDPGH